MSRAIVVASHRRSGTHLMLDSLRANAPEVHPRFLNLDRIEPRHPEHLPIETFDRRLRVRTGVVLVKTHGLLDARAWQSPEAAEYAAGLIAGSPTIYVHRDGRDVLASLYHYVGSYSSDVAGQTFGEFLRARHNVPDAAGLSRPAYWQHHVLTWLDGQPRALTAFAAMQTDFETTLREVGALVDLRLRSVLRPVTLEDRAGRLDTVRAVLRRRLGIGIGRRSTAIRPRAGGSGSWQELFDERDLALFQSDAGEAMRRLGYG